MSTTSMQSNPVSSNREGLAKACEQAVHHLKEALRLPVSESRQEVDEAERATVRLRDGLIEQWRHNSASAPSNRVRELLDQVNGALSLIVGVEYPATDVKWKLLKQARETLEDVLAELLKT